MGAVSCPSLPGLGEGCSRRGQDSGPDRCPWPCQARKAASESAGRLFPGPAVLCTPVAPGSWEASRRWSPSRPPGGPGLEPWVWRGPRPRGGARGPRPGRPLLLPRAGRRSGQRGPCFPSAAWPPPACGAGSRPPAPLQAAGGADTRELFSPPPPVGLLRVSGGGEGLRFLLCQWGVL